MLSTSGNAHGTGIEPSHSSALPIGVTSSSVTGSNSHGRPASVVTIMRSRSGIGELLSTVRTPSSGEIRRQADVAELHQLAEVGGRAVGVVTRRPA